jgi:anti-sigma factor RsiW
MSDAVQRTDHEYFEELCALATADVLSSAEIDHLNAHLKECPECAEHFAEYQSLASQGMRQLADFLQTPVQTEKFDQESALSQLLNRASGDQVPHSSPRPSVVMRSFEVAWRGLVAALVLLGVGLTAYNMGRLHFGHSNVGQASLLPDTPMTAGRLRILQARLLEAEKQKSALEQQVAQRTAALDRLQADNLDFQNQLKRLQSSLEAAKSSLDETKSDEIKQLNAVAQERDSLQLELRNAAQRSGGFQDELNRSRLERDQNLAQISQLQGQIAGLTSSANEQSRRVKDDEQYLASDKDIRDLIGARNLYIADIMDVREDGSSRKPFGRVFYTKTKSLIFYAYDLDKQPGIKQASTFQVWGRTSPNDTKPLNLGILYLDSETSRRWALRVSNPEQLSRLDAVFVTVETRPQTDKPTGKPFLYASLRREPNHP